MKEVMEWDRLLGVQRKPGDSNDVFNPLRSAFEMDFDRVIFSHPFRRLQDKTQVHPLPEEDFVHTRLSHSLEVSSVGRSLGKYSGKVLLERHSNLSDKFSAHDFGAIVAAASLTHDIGNPPFGHSGEEAISDFFRFYETGQKVRGFVNDKEWYDLTHFEGNAQGFRILNSNLYQGLSLTYATLAAFSKYPRPGYATKEKNRKSNKKFGYFQAEKEIFRNMAETLGLLKAPVGESSWLRHPLTFLVEAADDICYNIIDLEDGCRLGLISYKETEELLAPVIGNKFDREKLKKYKSVEERVGLLRAMAIGNLIMGSVEVFLDHEVDILSGNFDEAITDKLPANSSLNEISKVSLDKIYRASTVVETEAVGYEVLPGLLDIIVGAVYQNFQDSGLLSGRQKTVLRLIPDTLQFELTKFKNDLYSQMLVCTDFISGMTDSRALSFYRKLKGIDLPKT